MPFIAPKPPGVDKYSGMVEKIVTVYGGLLDQWAPWREKAIQCFEYVIGNQISDEDRDRLKAENRPALVFNLMQNKIITIAGLLEKNKAYMRAVPINEGDEQMADFRTQLVSDYAMKNCNGSREMAKAALDAGICGIGWTNNYWSTKDDPAGKWVTETVDPFMVMFDPDIRKLDQSDWRYMTYSGFYTAEEIIGIYGEDLDDETITEIKAADERLGGVRKSVKPTSWVNRILGGLRDFAGFGGKARTSLDHEYVTSYTAGTINDFVDARVGRYRVIEFHDRRTVIRHALYNPMTRDSIVIDRQTEGEADEQYAARRKDSIEKANLMSGGGYKEKTFVLDELWVTAVAPWLLPRAPLIEKAYPVQGKGFQFKPIFCYNLHPDITRTQSLIDILIDPQDSYNQRRMTFLEWIMNAVNPDFVVPKNSIAPEDMESWTSRKRGKVKQFTPVMGAKPEREHPLAEGASLKVFAEEDKNLTEQLTGITPNAQGLAENSNESGVLFAQKVQQAMTALAYFFGNMHFAMEQIFNYCDANLGVFMTLPRKIRVLQNPKDPQWIAVNMPTIQGIQNDVTQGEYDFKVDTEVLGETAKQIKFAEALAFVKTVPPEYVKWDELFALWDSPVAESMKQFASAMLQVTVGGVLQRMQQEQQANQIANLQGATGAITGLENLGNLPNEQEGRLAEIKARAVQLGAGPGNKGKAAAV